MQIKLVVVVVVVVVVDVRNAKKIEGSPTSFSK